MTTPARHANLPAGVIPVCFALAHCSAPQPPAHSGPVSSGHTRYEVGDYVVYRYTGEYTPAPVTLREEITAREGDRLTIDVQAERAGEIRHWIQVVTDTPENQRENRVDALYEVVGDERRLLANRGNHDLYRLYQWTLIDPDGRTTDATEQPCTIVIPTLPQPTTYADCVCTMGSNDWHLREIRMESSECAGFVWTHGPARYRDVASGADILRVDVVESGRRVPTAN